MRVRQDRKVGPMRITLPRLEPHRCGASYCQVPPSPELLAQLHARYLELRQARRLPQEVSFEEFYSVWRSSRRGENFVGLDDGATDQASSSEPQLIDRPPKVLNGVIKTIVLLVDFADRPHVAERTPALYE